MIDFIHSDDLDIKNGDWHTGTADNQHAKYIVQAQKGEYKEHPELGVGIENILNTEQAIDFLIEAKKNLEYDGMKVKDIAFTETGKLSIDAQYNERL
ncbi:oxidase [Riemerella columbipharyngis]|uniref:Uncharacterized protein n=1 Tax=Riemerella columbipharyngis TaxID=1071918 RepID=A0A1G7FLM9_9FLAO|nr:oxidase [Riemerella columbipharyngis]SDE76847.1 hypothetical protein SAMN05421544_12412 [Riemerella columbipharyngis]